MGDGEMYKNRKQRRQEAQKKIQHEIPHPFFLPFQGELDPKNRWMVLAEEIPWDYIEEKYEKLFCEDNGAPAKSARLAFGCLFIKEKCNFTDDETVAHIKENPYMQAFIGLDHFERGRIVEPSLFVTFRKRLEGLLAEVNEIICTQKAADAKDDPGAPSNGGQPPDAKDPTEPKAVDPEERHDPIQPDAEIPHNGVLILDATCAPADIAYPVDIRLLNDAREKAEGIIDRCIQGARSHGILLKKPRMYRKIARIQYLNLAKQRQPSSQKIRRAIRQQLEHVARDLRYITHLIENVPGSLDSLTCRQQKDLRVIHELYRQQREMYHQKKHHIENRIVSISQPHVRPIIRGKARTRTEFGAKVALSLVGGYVYIDQISWDNFNEGITLENSVLEYQRRFNCLPETILADQIYRNLENHKYCKKNHIRLSGPRLGRKNQKVMAEEKKQIRKDMRTRNHVEGKIGEGKRRYGLDLIMSKLPDTSVAEIIMQAIVMNLKKRLSLFLRQIRKLAYSVNFRVKKSLFSQFNPPLLRINLGLIGIKTHT